MSTRHTAGPWRWEVNLKSRRVGLCGGNPRFDLSVMDFTRWGTQGAAPEFREDVDRMEIMRRCEKWAVPVPGREHHAHWLQTLSHPDALLIQAAPDLLGALKELRDAPWLTMPGRANDIVEAAIARAEKGATP